MPICAEPSAVSASEVLVTLREKTSEAGETANVILPPWGVASLFGMLQTGARGDTARGMAAVLRLGDGMPTPDETAATFREARAMLGAAATASLVSLCIDLRRPRAFVADRPFLLHICETGSGIVLFIGRVVKPRPPVGGAPWAEREKASKKSLSSD